MTTYKDIRGTHIKTVTTDPPAPLNGQMWYNSTTKVMKGFTSSPAGSFATGGNLNSARDNISGTGTQTAGLVTGGPGGSNGYTELYNGSSWTEAADLNTSRDSTSQGRAATQTATIVWGGYPTYPGSYRTETESWNGSAWTEVNDLSYGQSNGGAAGTSTSAIFGSGTVQPGNPFSGDFSPLSQSWNGTSWTTVSSVNNARYGLNSSGGGASNTSAIIYGGLGGPSPYTAKAFTETWNGSSWTEVNDMNTARYSLTGTGATITAAIAFAGTIPGPPIKSETEVWNGTSWSEDTDIPTASTNAGSGGTSSSAFVAGGNTGSDIANTFEWTTPTTSTVTFTAS